MASPFEGLLELSGLCVHALPVMGYTGVSSLLVLLLTRPFC